MQTVLCIMGPTASGKTALALDIAKQFPSEIISVDSALVYKGLNIGSAKPTLEERQGVPHHLIDIIEADDSYNAMAFANDAKRLIKSILNKNKLPILVGGTMLYFKALLHGFAVLPEADKKIRQDIEDKASQLGWQYCYDWLKQLDPIAAGRIHPNDPQRISRALEINVMTGQPCDQHYQAQMPQHLPYHTTQIGLIPQDRAVLHQRINERFLAMVNNGFIEEVAELRKNPRLNLNCPAMRAVGYRQIWQYLECELSHTEMLDKAMAATRQLAKRQLTWLRSWPGLTAIDPLEHSPQAIIRQLKLC